MNIAPLAEGGGLLGITGDYWGFDTRSVTVQHMENIAIFETSSELGNQIPNYRGSRF